MPTTKLKNLIYLSLLPFCAPRCDPQPVTRISGHPISQIRSIEKLYRKFHVLGSSTLLSDGNNDFSLILTDSSDPCHHAEEDTFFRVASITKLATAVLTMHLHDQKIIDIDHPVSSFFPHVLLNKCFERITVRHLLSHTSGLTDPPDLESALNKGISFPDLISMHHETAPLDSFHYSNLGFGIIGCILESVFEQPVGKIFEDRLFSPLHMNATIEGCKLDPEKIMPVTRIFPYHRGRDLILTPLGSKPLLSPDPLRHYGHTAGSLYADIYAILKLIRLLSDRKGSFLSSDSINEILKEHAAYGSLSPTLTYGLGLLRIDDPSLSDHMIYGHQGFAYGCADGAFWEDMTGRIMITLNGGCSEARCGRLGSANKAFLRWALKKELPSW